MKQTGVLNKWLKAKMPANTACRVFEHFGKRGFEFFPFEGVSTLPTYRSLRRLLGA